MFYRRSGVERRFGRKAMSTHLNFNGESLIRMPITDTKANYLAGFWRWVELLAVNDFRGAIEALYWSRPATWTPDKMKERITTFFGGPNPWSVVIPNDRLINVINDAAEFEPRNKNGCGWFMAQIPLTTEPTKPKDDEIPLMGLASSFFVRENLGSYVMEHEIFHL